MQHLRIVGVGDEENRNQLILSDDDGNEYSLPVDDALRSAAGRAARQSSSSDDSPAPLSPREIQARLRAGDSVAQVVEDSGLDHKHVERYAGPVQAERSYIAQRARSTEVAAASTAEHHRLAFGDAPASLEAMVKVRLRAMEVELKTVSWDAWRREDGRWTVECWFDAGSSETHGAGIGLQPPAEWTFIAESRQLTAANRWAESLSSLPLPGKSRRRGSSRHLAAVDAPFDVDAEHSPSAARDRARSAHESAQREPQQPQRRHDAARRAAAEASQNTEPQPSGDGAEGGEHEDLLDVLRARRGQRLGADEESDEKLALMLTRDEQGEGDPVEPRLRPVVAPEQEPGADPDEQFTGPIPGLEDSGVSADRSEDSEEQDAAGTDAWGFSYEDGGEETEEPSPEEAPEQKEPEQREEAPEPRHRKRSSSRRPSMPKWDDILFGGKD